MYVEGQPGTLAFCIKCNKPIYLHKEPCKSFTVNLDDEWGMARRSKNWQDAEHQLRKVVCSEYGHIFFPGSPFTWKNYCARCGERNPDAE